MKAPIYYLFFGLFAILPAAQAQHPKGVANVISGQFIPFGFQDKSVTALALQAQTQGRFVEPFSSLFAAIRVEGIYKISPQDSGLNWQAIGLEGKIVRALTVQVWGVGPANGLALFAAVDPDLSSGDSTLIYKKETFFGLDTLWMPADSGIVRKRLKHVNALNSYYFTGHTPPQPVLMGGEQGLYYAWFRHEWTEASVKNPATVQAIDVNPHWFGTLAWAAGKVGLSPATFRSTDKGQTWETIMLPSLIEGEALSVLIHPQQPDTVYAGQIGGVWQTRDGGENWQFSQMTASPVAIRALAVDPGNVRRIFAAGEGPEDEFALFQSDDAGQSWSQVVPASSARLAGVSAMVVAYLQEPERQTRVFLATQGTGIWLYLPQTPTSVPEVDPLPADFELYQNYPNPFNASTLLTYQLSQPAMVTLSVMDILGHSIQTLVHEKQPVGFYRIHWDGRKNGKALASGVYLYELRVGGIVLRRKMVLIR